MFLLFKPKRIGLYMIMFLFYFTILKYLFSQIFEIMKFKNINETIIYTSVIRIIIQKWQKVSLK